MLGSLAYTSLITQVNTFPMSDDFEFLDYSPEGDALASAMEIIHNARSQWESRGTREEDLVAWFLQGAATTPDPSLWHPLPDGVFVAVAPRHRAIRVLLQMRNQSNADRADATIRVLSEPAAAGGMHALWSLHGRFKVGSITIDRDSADLRYRDDTN